MVLWLIFFALIFFGIMVVTTRNGTVDPRIISRLDEIIAQLDKIHNEIRNNTDEITMEIMKGRPDWKDIDDP